MKPMMAGGAAKLKFSKSAPGLLLLKQTSSLMQQTSQ